MAKKRINPIAEMLRATQRAVKDDNARHSISKIPSIIEFVENKEWLGMMHYSQPIKPWPVQRVLLKCLYRGSEGNEDLSLTSEEIDLINDCGLNCEDNGDILSKWQTGKTFRELVLVWGRRCLSEDATVVDPETGKTWRVGELWDYGKTELVSLAYDELEKDMKVMTDCSLINNGVQSCFYIRTTSGHSIEATDNHPMLTKNGWVDVKNLETGDKIAIAPSIPFFGNRKTITKTQATVLGYLSSQSFFSVGGHVGIATEDTKVLQDFKEKAMECSDCILDIKKADEYSLESTGIADRNLSYVCLQNSKTSKTKKSEQSPNANNISSLSLTHGLKDCKNKNKIVPARLMQCQQGVVSAYIRALFSADGKLEETENGYSLVVLFKSKTLARDIQSILQRYGIFSVVQQCIDESFSLVIERKQDIKTFINEIGLVNASAVIAAAKKKLKRVSMDDSPIFVPIEKIIPIGEKRTFDIAVSEKPHLMNFVADGFIVHNSGKGFITSIIALYEAMKLLETPGGNPYAIYDLGTAAPFMILTIANSGPQAGHLFKEIKDKVMLSTYFKDRLDIGHLTADTIVFLTPHDLDHNEGLVKRGLPPQPGSIQIMTGHSNSDSLVGMSCYCLLLDEIGLYKNTAGSASGDRIYNGLAPAVWTTYIREADVLDESGAPVLDDDGNPKKENVSDGKIICISSPRGKEGIFFDLYSHAHEVDHRLMMRLPTWKVNPRQTEERLRIEFPNMPEEKFRMEFGAEFSGTGGIAFFPRDAVEKCFSHARLKEIGNGAPGIVYFAHLDPALSSHNYGLVICHREVFLDPDTKKRDFRIVVDHVKYWSPSPDKLISSEDVDSYMIQLNRRFHFGLVTYDQWNCQASIQKLRSVGMPALETKFSRKYKMMIYDNLFELVVSERLVIPDKTLAHNLLRQEMINLEKKYLSTGGYRVQPKADGDIVTDDLVDALAGSTFNALDRAIRKLPQGKLVNIPVSTQQQVFRQMQGPIPDQAISKTSPSLQRWVDTTRGSLPYGKPGF